MTSLIRILKECGARRVFLFGSVARGEERPGSDVDLACEGLHPERFFEALGKLLLCTGRDIDLVDLDEAKGPLRERIEKEGVLLYEAG
ncbi:nucleotidyltransferase family protein [Candidatus Bipolaricaulota sp. J31]